MKECARCNVSQPEEQFNWRTKNVRRNTVCKSCHKVYRRQHYLANRQKYIDKARAWESRRGGGRFTKHGITEEAYNELLKKYDGKCWLCKEKEARVIDHDHLCCQGNQRCGKCIRGILCYGCNTGLGQFGDGVDGLRKAIEYLSHKH